MHRHVSATRPRSSLAHRIEATGSEDIPGVGASVVLAMAAFGAAVGALVGLFLDGAASTASAGAGVGTLAGLGIVLVWLGIVAGRNRWTRRPGGHGPASGSRRRLRAGRRKDRLAAGPA
jgi:hypothetical protein